MKATLSAYALALGLLAAGPMAAQAQGTAPTVSSQSQSDLADWRAAGFDEQTYAALSQDVYGAAYQQRIAKYEELRKLHSQGAQY
jgi:hypothetical protein